MYRPERWSELDALLEANAAQGGSCIARGLGRSYGDASLNDSGAVVLQTRLDRLRAFDETTGVVEAEAGVSIAQLIEVFLPRGFFPPVTPGTKYVTLGGAVAADVHGKNHHCDGSIGHHLLSLTLLTGTGEMLTCSPQENPDAFWATVGGMGLTGIIVSVRLQMQRVSSAYLRLDQQRTADLDTTLQTFAERDAEHQYSVAWIDCLAPAGALGRSVVMRGDHLDADDLSPRERKTPLAIAKGRSFTVPRLAPTCLLNATTMRWFNKLYYATHKSREGDITHFEPYFYPLDKLRHWNRLYPKPGFIQYQAVFPPDQSRAGLVELLEQVREHRRGSFLAVLKSFGPGSDGLLSFPMEGHTISLDMPANGAITAFTQMLDKVVLRHGGRVYLAKDACLEASSLAAMYPRLDQFREVKARLDPNRRFVSSLARRLNL